MSDINNLSTEQLLEELKKRKAQEAMSIDEKIAEMTPNSHSYWKSATFDGRLDGLRTICEEYINETIANGWVDEDLSHYIFEEALQSMMGRDVFEKLREIEKLKKQKK
jgi:hypothetical protein